MQVWDIRLKILRLRNFHMLFQPVLTKLNCFRVYRKLITCSSHAKSLLPKTIASTNVKKQCARECATRFFHTGVLQNAECPPNAECRL